MEEELTPQEEYNAHAWYVLKKLKKATLYTTGKEKVATYLLAPDVFVAGGIVPSHEQEVSLLNQFQEKGVIEVQEVLPTESDSNYRVRLDHTRRVLFKLIEPTFSNLYRQYEETFSTRTNHSTNVSVKNSVKSIGEEVWKDGKSVDQMIEKYPNLKESLEQARKTIESQREAVQRLYTSGAFQQMERYQEEMSKIADHLQPALKALRMVSQSSAMKLSQERAPFKLSAEITPTVKNISASIQGIQSTTEAIVDEKSKEKNQNEESPVAQTELLITLRELTNEIKILNQQSIQTKVKENLDISVKHREVKTKATDNTEKIEKVTIIEMNNGEHLVAVNNNYEEAKKIQNQSDWWQIFIREVKERNMLSETRMDVKEIPKGMKDYFNYNTIKCAIYMGGKYSPTSIFLGQNIDTMINSDIKTEILTEKQYLTKRKKVRKK